MLYANDASVCYPYLTQYKNSCIPSLMNKDGVHISSNVSLQQSESTASQLKTFQSFLSSQCQAVALPFLCLYLFPLCDENQTIYLPSMAECISISTDICKSEWMKAMNLQLVTNLPVCSTLPNTSPCNRTWHILYIFCYSSYEFCSFM